MTLEIENQGEIDLANHWIAGECTRHVNVRHNVLRKLKEDGILLVKRIPGPTKDGGLQTKNLAKPDFEKHLEIYTLEDNYLNKS